MSKHVYGVFVIVTMFAAAFVDYLLKPVLPLWLRAPAVGLFVGLVVLLAGIFVKTKNKQGG